MLPRGPVDASKCVCGRGSAPSPLGSLRCSPDLAGFGETNGGGVERAIMERELKEKEKKGGKWTRGGE